MRFDYLHSSRPALLARLLELRIPERLQSAAAAFAGSILFVFGASGIERYRLHAALSVQEAYQQRYDALQAQVGRRNVAYSRIRALLELDRRVRRIAISGDQDARALAEIANTLPEHAWLTGITRDSDGLTLDGHAKDLAAVASVIQGLMRAKHLANPTLITAALDKVAGRGTNMKYEVHVERQAR